MIDSRSEYSISRRAAKKEEGCRGAPLARRAYRQYSPHHFILSVWFREPYGQDSTQYVFFPSVFHVLLENQLQVYFCPAPAPPPKKFPETTYTIKSR